MSSVDASLAADASMLGLDEPGAGLGRVACFLAMHASGRLLLKAIAGLVNLVAVLGVVLFAGAGTFAFTEAWVFLGLFAAVTLAITLDLASRDPALLARRTQAGPLAEKEWSQKVIQGIAGLAFLATLLVPALDHRFGWSRSPWPLVVAGDALVLVGFAIVFVVFRANTFTSTVIEVASEQRVVDTGPYGVVRHPMYAGALVLVLGVPLALGSLVGLATLPVFVVVLAWRLIDEERFLVERLEGYRAYTEKVPRRLVPYLW